MRFFNTAGPVDIKKHYCLPPLERFDLDEISITKKPALSSFYKAFLQRIVNSGGRVEREYGLGKMRTDLLVVWKHEKGKQEVVIELKIKYDGLDATIKKGLKQTAKYMDKCGSDQGHLVIFDRDTNMSWDDKIFLVDIDIDKKDHFRSDTI